MSNFGEQDDNRPEGGESEVGQEPSSPPFYDPLIAPWDEPSAPAASHVVGPELGPVFWPEQTMGSEMAPTEKAWIGGPAPTVAPRQEQPLGPWQPAGYQRPYEESERPSDLQRHLREGTITVPRQRWRWAVHAREGVETLLLALLIFLAVRTSFQNFRVEGASMVPSLDNGEYLIVNKLAYAEIDLSLFDWLPLYNAGENPVHHLWSTPSRGDVIVFLAPQEATGGVERDFVKRIIGVPGDTIAIDPAKNQVLVNGGVITEPYILGATTCSRGCGPWELPPANTPAAYAACGSRACYFVMGDNRQNSSDSRQGWLVPEENIIGKALITYWNDGSPELDLAPNHAISLSGQAAAAEE